MSVLEALIGVIPMQLVTILKGVTPALATLDTQAMDFLAWVSVAIFQPLLIPVECLSLTMELRYHQY